MSYEQFLNELKRVRHALALPNEDPNLNRVWPIVILPVVLLGAGKGLTWQGVMSPWSICGFVSIGVLRRLVGRELSVRMNGPHPGAGCASQLRE